MKNNFWLLDKKVWNCFIIIGIFILTGRELAWAEEQFGGDVEEFIPCDPRCGGLLSYVEVGDPHGGDNGNNGKYVVSTSTIQYDCKPLSSQTKEIIGKHKEEEKTCKVKIYGNCVKVYTSSGQEAKGKVIKFYGNSKNDCGSGLSGDASGDGKTKMETPDSKRKSDGTKSGGGDQEKLKTVDNVKADGSNASHMTTPDNQNHEGSGTSHMETDDSRNYEGNNDTEMTSSGKDSGYSSAGGGRGGHGYGSVGGSVGSGGLQSPVVLGDQDQEQEDLQKKDNFQEELDIEDKYNIQKTSSKEVLFNLLIVLGGVGGAGYFVFRSIKKMLG